MCKVFADDISLYSIINDLDTCNIAINNDLVKISRWAYQWKMSFHPDINKQALEVYFSQRRAKSLPPPIIFNNNNVVNSPCRKHLGLVLDSKLSFIEHVDQKVNKCNRILGLMKRHSLTLSRKQLFTIYKIFVRSHLDYADIIYDKPFNDAFKKELEKVQYSGAINDTSRERFYKELGLESVCDTSWYCKLVFFYKIVIGLAPSYFQSCLLPDNERADNTRSSFTVKFKSFK